MINQSKSNAPIEFLRILSLIANVNDVNGIVSTYGTNFKYIYASNESDLTYAATKPIIYDDQCSCGLNKNCTSQANFIIKNSSEMIPIKVIPIKGLKIGCIPSESFRASTLECFYDFSCINIILQYANYTNGIDSKNISIPLSSTMNKFSINTIIDELINNLFVDKWITTIDYSSYFNQCSPLLCSYTYIQQINPLYLVTLLLGLHGGLSFVLQWLCPKIVRIIAKAYQYWTKRTTTAQHVSFLEIATIQTTNTNVCNPTLVLEPIPTNVASRYDLLIFVF
jgi:hypothetical protein